MSQIMNKQTHRIAWIVPTPRYGAKAQLVVLHRAGVTRPLTAREASWAQILRMIRADTVLHVARGYLIADQKALRSKGGRFASWVRRLHEIESAGGVLHDVEKDWLSSRKSDKSAMLARYVIDLRQASREPTGRPPGRRPVHERFEAQRAVIEDEWLSRKHATNADAVARMNERGVRITANDAWKCMEHWTGKGGSGRTRRKAK
jgi:hypothetical protein